MRCSSTTDFVTLRATKMAPQSLFFASHSHAENGRCLSAYAFVDAAALIVGSSQDTVAESVGTTAPEDGSAKSKKLLARRNYAAGQSLNASGLLLWGRISLRWGWLCR